MTLVPQRGGAVESPTAILITSIIGQIIARTPQAWMYQQYRLEEMLTQRPTPVAREASYVEDAQHNTVAQVGK